MQRAAAVTRRWGEWPRLALPALRREHLYFLIAFAVGAVCVSLCPLPPNDFWWHLKVGQLIAQGHHVPSTNMFSWTIPTGAHYVYGEWFGELLFYLLYAAGGTALVCFAHNLLGVGAFTLIGLEARRRSGSWRLAAMALVITSLVGLNSAIVRTQNWAWLPFGVYMVILWRYADGRLHPRCLLLLPAVMVFWVNVHGSFPLGILLVGAVAVGETVRAMMRDPGRLPVSRIGWLYATCASLLVATLLNPRGAGILAYVHDLLTDAPSQKLIVEWQPPTESGVVNLSFFATILLLIGAVAYARRRPTPTDLLLTCGLLWLAWGGQRYVVWFGMVAPVVIAQSLSSGRRRSGAAEQPALANLVLAAVVLLPVVFVQPWLVDAAPLPSSFRAQTLPSATILGVRQPPLLSTANPVTATEYLRAHPGGRLFNEMGYGSYLIWALPEQKVFVDTRVELYPYQQWLDYLSIGKGHGSEELLARYGADRVMLSLEDQPALSKVLAASSHWRREYRDQWCEIWTKTQ